MDKNIVISIKTILLTILIGLGLYVIYRLGSIIGVVLIAMLITISLEHTVKFFKILFCQLLSDNGLHICFRHPINNFFTVHQLECFQINITQF